MQCVVLFTLPECIADIAEENGPKENNWNSSHEKLWKWLLFCVNEMLTESGDNEVNKVEKIYSKII